MPAKECILVLGDTLFLGLPQMSDSADVLMVESVPLCTRVRHHKQKLVLVLSAMRHFRTQLEKEGRTVHYHSLSDHKSFTVLDAVAELVQKGLKTLHVYGPHDGFFRTELTRGCETLGLELRQVESPMFLTPKERWQAYVQHARRLHMADFYIQQRKALNLLVTPNGSPEGGKWSFDPENRKPFPKNIQVPTIPFPDVDSITKEVIAEVEQRFPNHPGTTKNLRVPVTHEGAKLWLENFLEHRIDQFGDYEDAISKDFEIAFHSVLTPMLNTGLLTPSQVVEATLARHQRAPVPLNSLEGFLRQVVGWREFIKGVYEVYLERGLNESNANTLQHSRQMKPCWIEGSTGLPPVDHVIAKLQKTGYCHHIERLMVLGATMMMCEIRPDQVYQWFMEMFIDSADWVMLPNVIGMSQFADGGLFATKPYFSGSAYILRMSNFARGDWCDIWDGLYWRFIQQNRDLFQAQPRLKPVLLGLNRLAPERKDHIFSAAESFIDRTTTA
jgi:deoxyribodipyrimidine photolyase-related protein